MSKEVSAKILQQIMKESFENKGASSWHLLDDEELLLQWSNSELTPTERDALLSHLARCSYCRQGVAKMISSGILEFRNNHDAVVPTVPDRLFTPELPSPDRVLPGKKATRKRRPWWLIATAATCLSLGLFFLTCNYFSSYMISYVSSKIGSDISGVGNIIEWNDTDQNSDKDESIYSTASGIVGTIPTDNSTKTEPYILSIEIDLSDEQAIASTIQEKVQEVIATIQNRSEDAPPIQVIVSISNNESKFSEQATNRLQPSNPNHDAGSNRNPRPTMNMK